ncbi:MAG: tRNA (N(6)-L-threonylcarbamoyladenosine(37)-C(2))-methylthiotransferase MtaB [Pseudomonadota bacterium]|nr:tRNA (N(6)-L-threonylcarbamoyladenosine(37)-C(2))-methylthiotransferase MtaB [Pseudomonadota bacterium]QKK04836.1 MAG: tRNA (N(6)-L-threonylcarbamoyladenosine(37)-C(2))-methylthiotransferase MtaB [Pseudomonadota bacterium]
MDNVNTETVAENETTAPQDIDIVTFGCRLNIHESEVMRDHAKSAGLKDTVIINTCAVTKEAERSARQAIRRLRRERPSANIVVTGCSAQIDPASYAKMPEVNHVIGNDLKLKAETWQSAQHPPAKVLVNDIMSVKETAGHLISGFETHARAFVQVQNGCDHRCTFCIIPFGRGNSRSVPIGEIVDQVRKLVAAGYAEVVLTGVDVTSYGPDLPGNPTLGQMIRRLLALVPELTRLRLSSLDPVEIDDDLWHLIEHEPRLMPHLHLSVQAGDDMILKRMKRRHLRKDILDVCEKARRLRPDIVFGADIIAGFPTETDEMFENTRKLVAEAGLAYLHVFPYSPRPGTPAARMPQVAGNIRKSRAAILRAEGATQLQALLAKHDGSLCNVLVEKNNAGHSEHFLPVVLQEENDDVPHGTLLPVRITGITEDKALGVRA